MKRSRKERKQKEGRDGMRNKRELDGKKRSVKWLRSLYVSEGEGKGKGSELEGKGKWKEREGERGNLIKGMDIYE